MSLSFANKVRETSTTTGTGTYDLAGAATGYAGFVAAVGDAAVVTYRAQMGNDWEIGIGTITDAATDTLARTEVLETLVGGTYTKTGATAVDWGPGTKTIELIGPAQAMQKDSGWFLPHPGQTVDDRYYSLYYANTNVVVPASTQWFVPHEHTAYEKIELFIKITTGEADKLLDLGLYDWVAGNPGSLLESDTAISLTSTGTYSFLTSAKYPPGHYFFSGISDATGTAQLRGTNSTPSGHRLIGDNNDPWNPKGLEITRSYASELINPYSGTPNDHSANIPLIFGRPATS